MQAVPEKSTLVLAGAFNPAILTPPWIARNILDRPEGEQFPVQMLAQIAGFTQLPRFSFDGLSFSPSFQNVTFFLQGLDDSACERVCDVASRILRLLPHTPVIGVGFNFGFTTQQPGVGLLRLLAVSTAGADALAEGSEILSRSWVNLVRWQGALVTVQAQISGADTAVNLNFHYEVQTAAAADQILQRQNVYAAHKVAAEKVVAALNHEG